MEVILRCLLPRIFYLFVKGVFLKWENISERMVFAARPTAP